jgi:signal transduction histidine kinase/CheY-like chemotaxis protein
MHAVVRPDSSWRGYLGANGWLPLLVLSAAALGTVVAAGSARATVREQASENFDQTVAAAVAPGEIAAEALRGVHDDVGLIVRDADATGAAAAYTRAATRAARGAWLVTPRADLRAYRRVSFAGRTWQLENEASSDELAGVARREPTLVLILGLTIAALVYALLQARWSLQSRARSIARGMTAALRASEERYALALSGSDEGHWDWEMATDRLYLSPKARELFDLPCDYETTTFTALRASHRVAGEDCPSLEAALRDHLGGLTPRLECEYRVDAADGLRWLVARGQCIRRSDGRAVRMAGSVIDVTDRRRAETERRRLEESRRQADKLEALGTLAGGIAHEFNNVLGAIVGYGELAQQTAAPGTAARRYADQILAAGERARALVDRVLALAGADSGPSVRFAVQPAVREALRATAAHRPAGVRLRSRLRAPSACVRGDPAQIRELVGILWSNALQSMPRGGQVEATLTAVTLHHAHAVSTCVLAPGNYARLAIRDDGVGIDMDDLPRIFEPFFTTRDVGVGTGLGLPRLSAIATEFGGGVDVASTRGSGATFCVYLPLNIASAESSLDESAARGAGAIVMLVDDEPALVRLGEELLASLGYEPVGFTSGHAALEAARASPRRFDLVLTDEKMPGLGGCELAIALRAAGATAPVLIMSGYGGPALRDRARAAGVRAVLAKPLRAAELARALADALGASTGLQS